MFDLRNMGHEYVSHPIIYCVGIQTRDDQPEMVLMHTCVTHKYYYVPTDEGQICLVFEITM